MERIFDPTKAELEKLYQFYSCTQIGKQFGVNAETVRKRIHEHKIPVGKVGGRRSFDPPKDILFELYQTKSMLEIAKHFGVGETVVFKRLKEHGIELTEHKNHRLKPGRIFTQEHKDNIRKSVIERAIYGELNPHWKGGLTVLNLRARNNWQAKEWKRNSLVRADHSCEVCGIKNGFECDCCGFTIKLHVHHIHSFAKHPELRYDVTNSEVLCPKCHKIKHQMKTV